MSSKKKLVQVGEYSLHGNVESLGKVKLRNANRESLLLSFSQAKVSHTTITIITTSIITISAIICLAPVRMIISGSVVVVLLLQ